jgi:heme a synthase
METAIELTHRLTSGLTLLALGWLGFETRRSTTIGHPARRWALFSFAFLIVESLVGAVLVLFALVGQNSSWARAVVMAVHLVNTSFLVAAIHATSWALSESGARRLSQRPSLGALAVRAALGAVLLLGVSAAGAVTALGDTLYPVEAAASQSQVLLETANSGAHFLERLRSFHPLFAVAVAGYLLYVAADAGDPKLRMTLFGLLGLQVGLGLMNVALGAPGWMQVVHLTVGTLLWLAWAHFTLDASFPEACLKEPVE